MTDNFIPWRANVQCPYCGRKNRVAVPQYGIWRPEVIVCEIEEGGCDAAFAVTVDVQMTITPKVRRIEGCEPLPPVDDEEGEGEA